MRRPTIGLAFCVASPWALADVLRVPEQFPSIQEAIDAASNSDEVVVAPGTYDGGINLLGKQITVRSSNGPRITLIDMRGFDGFGITCNSGETVETTIEGFTIMDATIEGGALISDSGATIRGCTFLRCESRDQGGGVLIERSEALIEKCEFTGCTAERGGAVAVIDSHATIRRSLLGSNSFFGTADGAGLYAEIRGGQRLVVEQCAFVNNVARTTGGAMTLIAAGAQSRIELTRCFMADNDADDGGGIHATIEDGAELSIHRCSILSNVSEQDGGGLFLNASSGSRAIVSLSEITANDAADNGAGARVLAQSGATVHFASVGWLSNESEFGSCLHATIGDGAHVELANAGIGFGSGGGAIEATVGEGASLGISNATITGNDGDVAVRIDVDSAVQTPGTATIVNSIVWGNEGEQIVAVDGPIDVRYTDVEGGHAGVGNVDLDPRFSGELQLAANSPLLNIGDEASIAVDAADLDGDGDRTEPIPIDLATRGRLTSGGVDLGAYEKH